MNEQIRHQAAAAYVPPTPEQLAAGADMVARWADNWNEPNPDSDYFRNLMHSDTRNQIPPMTAPADREGVVAHFSEVLRRLPDLRIKVVRWAPTADCVLIEWLAAATVAGEKLEWTGVDRIRIRGDRAYEARVYWDTRQLDQRMMSAVQAATDRAKVAQ
jgi:predicted SnoaL-like aldol condensation-catalyzing enzyme